MLEKDDISHQELLSNVEVMKNSGRFVKLPWQSLFQTLYFSGNHSVQTIEKPRCKKLTTGFLEIFVSNNLLMEQWPIG